MNALKAAATYIRREPWTCLMAAILTGVMLYSWLAPKQTGGEGHFSETERLATTQKIEALGERINRDPAARAAVASGVLAAALIVLLGVLWGGAWGSSIRRGEGWMERFASPRVLWGLNEAAKGLILLFFLDLILSTALSFIFTLFKLGSVNIALMLGSFLRSVLVLVLLGRTVRRAGGRWEDLGWCLRRPWRQAGWGLAGYLAMIPVYAAVLGVLMTALKLFQIRTPVQTPVQVFYTEPNAAALWGFAVFMGILGPWFEEIFFRGFLYPAFRERFGVGRSILITSVIFAALHGHGVAFVPILVLGVALNLLYERSGSIVPGAVLHMTHNSAMLAITFAIRGAAL